MLYKEEREHQEDIINTYGGITDCDCDNCNECSDVQVEKCYVIAQNRCNSEFAELINYAGFDSEEEFWENL